MREKQMNCEATGFRKLSPLHVHLRLNVMKTYRCIFLYAYLQFSNLNVASQP